MLGFEKTNYEPKRFLGIAGQFSVSPEERDFLEQESQGEFEKHPKFEGVEIRSLGFDKTPLDIRGKIESIGGRITAFMVIKIEKEVPVHQHISDREIYFGGDNGIVTLYDDSKKEIGKFDLGEKIFTSVGAGEWHGVESMDERGSVFFGVKFIAKEV